LVSRETKSVEPGGKEQCVKLIIGHRMGERAIKSLHQKSRKGGMGEVSEQPNLMHKKGRGTQKSNGGKGKTTGIAFHKGREIRTLKRKNKGRIGGKPRGKRISKEKKDNQGRIEEIGTTEKPEKGKKNLAVGPGGQGNGQGGQGEEGKGITRGGGRGGKKGMKFRRSGTSNATAHMVWDRKRKTVPPPKTGGLESRQKSGKEGCIR